MKRLRHSAPFTLPGSLQFGFVYLSGNKQFICGGPWTVVGEVGNHAGGWR